MKKIFEKGSWLIEYDLEDGGRLNRLCFDGYDLLTTAPKNFSSPAADYGKYETRPVYGYDDCFPSVEKGLYPESNWNIPDHGEICWLKWNIEQRPEKLIFTVESKQLPIVFQRVMHFKQSDLIWYYRVINKGDKRLPFQHVMHPLIKLNQIKEIYFPDFEKIWNEEKETVSIQTPELLSEYLLNSHEGDVFMFYLQKIQNGRVSWIYKNDLEVRMVFPVNIFPTLGVWWNHSGYPDEHGYRRNECAFEPIPGRRSELLESYENKLCQYVDGKNMASWEVTWSMNQ